jgi:hypothetical protein
VSEYDPYSTGQYDYEIKLTGLDPDFDLELELDQREEEEVMNICETDEYDFHPYPRGVGKSLSAELVRAKAQGVSHWPDSSRHSEFAESKMEISDLDDDWNQRVPDSPRIRDMDSFDSFDSFGDDNMDMEDALLF